MTIILSNVDRFKKITGRFIGKFVVKSILKIPLTLHTVYVSAPLCETLTSRKQAINDKLQNSAETYLRYGGVVNNKIKIGLLLSL